MLTGTEGTVTILVTSSAVALVTSGTAHLSKIGDSAGSTLSGFFGAHANKSGSLGFGIFLEEL